MRTDGSAGAGESAPEHERERPGAASLELLFVSSYQELRRLAGCVCRCDPSATLNPTALVHEAWLKLSASPGFAVDSPLHFKRIAARAMRQVLVDAARRRKAKKRGGDALLVTFDEEAAGTTSARELLDLDEALKSLARIEPRCALVVEYRFFGGLEIPETAEVLGVSEATVLRDWRAARAWLAHELRQSS